MTPGGVNLAHSSRLTGGRSLSSPRRYCRRVDGLHRPAVVRVVLVVFVLAWLFGPDVLRDFVPIWLPFAIALGLELQFFVSAWRTPPGRIRPGDRGPQDVDRERFGYEGDRDELIVVRDDGGELWVPYAGEEGDELEALVARERERVAAGGDVLVVDDRPHPLRRLAYPVAVLAALAAFVWFVDSRSGWNGVDGELQAEAERLFSSEAARIARHRVEVRCDADGEYVGAVQHADGVAVVGGTRAYLTPERCHALYLLAFEGEYSFTPAGRAIVVLAHEAWHLNGIADEGTTHCYALQSGVRLGMRLGLTETVARRMMRQQFVENASRGRRAPEYLVSDDCRDGRSLDLRPGDPEFP